MTPRKLILRTNPLFGDDWKEKFRCVGEAGFDGVFTFDHDERIGEYAAELHRLGLVYQSVHAPYRDVNLLWEDGADRQAVEAVSNRLLFSLSQCRKYEIPLLVLHAYIGFEKRPISPQTGIERFGKIVREAENSGVKLAFENTEGLECLDTLMKAFAGEKHVGFCWDSGHEMCYNGSENLLARYGDRLFGTHLNDNLGVKDVKKGIFWTDDLHLLPYDGIADWEERAARLAALPFDGPLTFELKTHSKPNRHDNDKYTSWPATTYLAEAYARACRLRAAIERKTNLP